MFILVSDIFIFLKYIKSFAKLILVCDLYYNNTKGFKIF